MKEAIYRARDARMEILRIMSTAIDKPRATMSPYAPRIVIIKIDPEYIGKVIGPGGSMVKGIQEQTKSVIEIEEDGTIMISSTGGGEGHLEAKSIIENMTTPPQVGRMYRKRPRRHRQGIRGVCRNDPRRRGTLPYQRTVRRLHQERR